jgi:hypothetical protein
MAVDAQQAAHEAAHEAAQQAAHGAARRRRAHDELRDAGEELRDIIDDLRVLAQKEAELARAEMREQAGLTRNAAIGAALAALLVPILLTFAALTLMFALDEATALWLAALITTLVVLALVLLAAAFAYTMYRRISIVPRRTVDSIQEDVRWARRRISFSER